jgi:hypothetical protein
MKTNKTNQTTKTETLSWGDPMWCSLDNTRVRYSKTEYDGMIEVMNNDGTKILPDLRHPSQLRKM